MRAGAAITASLVLAALVTGAHADDTITVGAIYPLSGGAGPQGQHVVKAIQAIAAIINADGGVLGKKLVVVARDDESTPAVGVSRADEMVGAKAAVVFEGWNSPVTLAMQPVLARAGILDITTSAQADAIVSGEGNPLAVRMNTSNAQAGEVVADILAKRLKVKRIAWMAENDAYGNGAQAAQEGDLKAQSYTYDKVADERFPFAQADFRVALSNVKAAHPEATVLISANQGLGLPALIRQARQIRLGGAVVASAGILTPEVIKLAGQEADGLVGADVYFPDVPPFASNEANERFAAEYTKLSKLTPDKNDALAAAAVEVWAAAAAELKTLDREAIAKRIRGGQFAKTVFGQISFEPNGQSKLPLYVFTVKDGKIVVSPE